MDTQHHYGKIFYTGENKTDRVIKRSISSRQKEKVTYLHNVSGQVAHLFSWVERPAHLVAPSVFYV